jgi:hypothetical protein
MLEYLPKWVVVCSAIIATGVAINTLVTWYNGISKFYLGKKATINAVGFKVLFWINEVNKPFFMVFEGAFGHAHRQHFSGLWTWLYMCAIFFLWMTDWWCDWRNQQIIAVGEVASSLKSIKDHITTRHGVFEQLIQELGKELENKSEEASNADKTQATATTKLALRATVEHDYTDRILVTVLSGIMSTFILKSRRRTLCLINSVIWFAIGLYLLFA